MSKVIKYKKALVTGGAGFIGSHIVDRLIDLGIETIVIDDLSMGKKDNVSGKAKLVVADILDYEVLKKVMQGVDIVFHEAAKVSIRNSFDNFYNDSNVNIMGTVNVLRAIVENKVKKIIYASSMAVYGNNKLPISEDSLLEPISPYGVGKLASEKYCLLMGKFSRFDVVCLRYFNTYGLRQTLTPYVGVITIFIDRLLKNQPPVIFGNGRQVRDFIHVDDVVEANILAMNRDIDSAVLNVGTGIGTSVNQVAGMLVKKINPGTKAEHAPERAEEPADSIASNTQAKKLIGFKARFKLEERIDEVIGHIKNR